MRSCWPWDKINIFLRYGKLVSVEKVDDTFGVALAVVIVDVDLAVVIVGVALAVVIVGVALDVVASKGVSAVVPSSWCCC